MQGTNRGGEDGESKKGEHNKWGGNNNQNRADIVRQDRGSETTEAVIACRQKSLFIPWGVPGAIK